MSRLVRTCFLLLAVMPVAAGSEEPAQFLSWSRLPDLPGTTGLGGPFAGVHGGVLIVAGGANFPDAPPWKGGDKVWHDKIYVLEKGAPEWTTGFELKRPLAYGASITLDDGIVLIGGCDAGRSYAAVTLVRWDASTRKPVLEPLPPLPEPSAFHAAGLIGDSIYVAAGRRSNDPEDLAKAFWALDLSRLEGERKWIELDPWPGPARIKAVAAVQSTGSGRQ